jgi:hypothetical protein
MHGPQPRHLWLARHLAAALIELADYAEREAGPPWGGRAPTYQVRHSVQERESSQALAVPAQPASHVGPRVKPLPPVRGDAL